MLQQLSAPETTHEMQTCLSTDAVICAVSLPVTDDGTNTDELGREQESGWCGQAVRLEHG